MTQYVLEFYDKHKNEDISTYEHITEAEKTYSEVIRDPATTRATLTAAHMRRGTCYREELIKEYKQTH